jgi:hypothetical protein
MINQKLRKVADYSIGIIGAVEGRDGTEIFFTKCLLILISEP